MRKCKECSKDFVPKSHGGTKEFCSYSCSNKYKWKFRQRNPKPVRKRNCDYCGKEYDRSYSLKQWASSKYCSRKCAGQAKRIRDGMRDKGERYRRKKGSLKQGTPEWLEKIRSTTTDAMNKPDINFKLHKSRAPRSLEAKIKQSNALIGKMPKNLMFGNSAYPNVQRGNYENSKGSMYFRSKWEANYALYLDFLVKQKQIKKWEYEVDMFVFESIMFGTRSYRPDFKIFNNDGTFEYHEIKGYMDGRSKTKLKRMAKYYPEVKLVLVEKDAYTAIKRQVGKMLNFY